MISKLKKLTILQLKVILALIIVVFIFKYYVDQRFHDVCYTTELVADCSLFRAYYFLDHISIILSCLIVLTSIWTFRTSSVIIADKYVNASFVITGLVSSLLILNLKNLPNNISTPIVILVFFFFTPLIVFKIRSSI